MIHIRRATELDTSLIGLLGRVTFTESHGEYITEKKDLLAYLDKSFSIEQIKKELKDANNFFWIAFYKDFPIGYVARFERIYVLEDFIHLKIGRQLQDLVLKKAKDLKFNWIWLTVYIKNYRAINFYTKSKYKNIGTIIFTVGNEKHDNTVFAKELNS